MTFHVGFAKQLTCRSQRSVSKLDVFLEILPALPRFPLILLASNTLVFLGCQSANADLGLAGLG
jgi:hypothetical protein